MLIYVYFDNVDKHINQSISLFKHDMISKILFFIESRSSDVFDAGEFQTREFFHSFFMECGFYSRSVLYSDMLIYVYFDNVDKHINQSISLFKHDMISKILFFIESRSSDVFDAGEFQTREFFHSSFMECEFYPRSVLYSDMLIYVYFDNVDKPINQSIYLFKYEVSNSIITRWGQAVCALGSQSTMGEVLYKMNIQSDVYSSVV